LSRSLCCSFSALSVEIALLLFFGVISPNHVFTTANNLVNIAWDTAETLLLAIGETFVIITAGIDLSVGTVLMLSGVTASWVMAQTAGTPAQVVNNSFPNAGVAIALGIPAGLAVGIIAGAINGVLGLSGCTSRLWLPPDHKWSWQGTDPEGSPLARTRREPTVRRTLTPTF